MPRAVFHCHSTYSDGECTLAELREMFVAEGFDLACMTDHAEFFDAESLRAYREECDALSDERFRFVAGLEYECERRMHVLGYGVTTLAGTTDPQEVIRHIEGAGGVSVIAHPMDSMFEWIETFDVLPFGVEAWNTKYDGRYAPRARTFRLVERLQNRKPEMRAFYGTDLHWRHQYRGLSNSVACDDEALRRGAASARDAVLAALRRGDFRGVKDGAELPSSGELSDEQLARFESVNTRYHLWRNFLKRAKRMSGRVGKSLPAPIKSQLRRIF
ncbi:MAG TPA: PHP domain-containing protein [Pyrinomonadaceae bacterium]|nr:PHP domain-containing protein [Pyrinomonadaceae bacterium]